MKIKMTTVILFTGNAKRSGLTARPGHREAVHSPPASEIAHGATHRNLPRMSHPISLPVDTIFAMARRVFNRFIRERATDY